MGLVALRLQGTDAVIWMQLLAENSNAVLQAEVMGHREDFLAPKLMISFWHAFNFCPYHVTGIHSTPFSRDLEEEIGSKVEMEEA
jgi:hypothetical protein